MRRLLKTLAVILLLSLPTPVYAQEDMVVRQLDLLDFEDIERALGSLDGVPSFRDTVMSVIQGDIDLSPAGLSILAGEIFLAELSAFTSIMRNIIILAILSAILKNLTDSFKSADVGSLGFYVVFALLVALVFQAFNIGVSAATSMISTISNLMLASIPVLITLLVFSGNIAAPLVISPTLAFYAHISTIIINGIIVPLILTGVAMSMVNTLSERDILKNFVKLISTACGWALGLVAFSFGLILSLQKISSPIMSSLAGRTARTAVGAVPIVGDILGGAADIVGVWANAARSGVLVAIVIMVAIVCFATIIKLVALVFIFKLTAALISPICDKRIVECINSVGDFAFLLLACVATVVTMFILSSVILLQ